MSAADRPQALPILDLRRMDAGELEHACFLRDLRAAAGSVGFFYLIGHEIEDNLIADLLRLSRQFFELPAKDKLAIEMVKSPHFRGYNRAGSEYTRGKPDWREQLDIGAERPALSFDPSAPPWTRLQGPNQWPAVFPELKPAVLAYQEKVTVLAIRLLRAFAAALDQPENVFERIYSPAPHQLLKLIRYPGREPDHTDQGVGAHKDSGFITILLQEQEAGLQVEAEHGWIDAPPIPGTLIANVGEILEMASDGFLRANVHRVVSPPPGVDRISVAFFMGARLDATVPLLSMPEHLAAHARGVTRDPFNPLFRDVGRNYLKGRLRSHPDVARRHHPDLIDPTQSIQEPASAY